MKTAELTTAELREAYLSFFEGKGHRRVPSGTLVPQDDPTLLFTNAGMNQFKDPLLGRSDPGYSRATSAQRCVRAGGKHNDLENVGYTARHHTFFEMMGNFSFGDYFKPETIAWAWEFITEVLDVPPEKIWVTVHPTDAESRAIWIDDIGVAPERVIDLEENFWTMGDTGPCGPCTELFYDHGPEVEGGPPGSPDEDGDRYIEFWNLVFPQFDRSEDGTLEPLPKPGVDTGMGLERMAAILQHVHSNYEIDLFSRLMAAVGKFAGITDPQVVLANASLRVIADHIRSSAFLIADGIVPGSEDRAYVLRRIIRRGLRHGYKLNIDELFFHKLVDVLVEEMGAAYPILEERQKHIVDVLKAEEIRFGETLAQGMELLKDKLADIDGKVIPGDVVFQLYDTYGFPVDLTADVALEHDMEVDHAGFEVEMEAQRSRGRAATSFSTSLAQRIHVEGAVEFCGYTSLDLDAKVLGLFDMEGARLTQLSAGEEGVVVVAQTPFYAEAGGQVGDQGALVDAVAGANAFEFEVRDTIISGDQTLHIGVASMGCVVDEQLLTLSVSSERRERIRRNHSATHLLHAALRRVLGEHVRQKGSLVNDEKLRFDFSHDEPVGESQLASIEDLVNKQIRNNSEVKTELMNYNAAVESGAVALFGEKYGDEVRVLTMGEGYSVELCGGTHVDRTGDIGLLRITSEVGIAAGVRRIEAVTGAGALEVIRVTDQVVSQLSGLLKGTSSELVGKVESLLSDNKKLNRSLTELTQKVAAEQGSDLASSAVDIGAAKFLAAKIQGDGKSMMQTLDSLRSQLQSGVIVLVTEDGGKANVVISVSKNLLDQLKAPELMAELGKIIGVKGGGRPDMARAGGKADLSQLESAFASCQTFAEQSLT